RWAAALRPWCSMRCSCACRSWPSGKPRSGWATAWATCRCPCTGWPLSSCTCTGMLPGPGSRSATASLPRRSGCSAPRRGAQLATAERAEYRAEAQACVPSAALPGPFRATPPAGSGA
nr:hypothetical protein [Tanacetum cinerariifolium]